MCLPFICTRYNIFRVMWMLLQLMAKSHQNITEFRINWFMSIFSQSVHTRYKFFYVEAFLRFQRHAHSVVNWWHSENITELGIKSPDTWFSFSLFLAGVWESFLNRSILWVLLSLIAKWWCSPKWDNFENAATYNSISGFRCLK